MNVVASWRKTHLIGPAGEKAHFFACYVGLLYFIRQAVLFPRRRNQCLQVSLGGRQQHVAGFGLQGATKISRKQIKQLDKDDDKVHTAVTIAGPSTPARNSQSWQ